MYVLPALIFTTEGDENRKKLRSISFVRWLRRSRKKSLSVISELKTEYHLDYHNNSNNNNNNNNNNSNSNYNRNPSPELRKPDQPNPNIVNRPARSTISTTGIRGVPPIPSTLNKDNNNNNNNNNPSGQTKAIPSSTLSPRYATERGTRFTADHSPAVSPRPANTNKEVSSSYKKLKRSQSLPIMEKEKGKYNLLMEDETESPPAVVQQQQQQQQPVIKLRRDTRYVLTCREDITITIPLPLLLPIFKQLFDIFYSVLFISVVFHSF